MQWRWRAGFGYDKLTATASTTKAFVFLYCLANFFQNFGPNTTTFVIPGEVFPTRYRSTAHGISAASGKLGAVVAQVGFARLKDIGGKNKFVKHMCVFVSCRGCHALWDCILIGRDFTVLKSLLSSC